MAKRQQIIAFLRQHETKLRFLLAGGLNTGFGLGIYPALYAVLAPLALHYTVILVIAQVISITFAYLTNKFFAFRTSGNYLREYGRFILFHLAHLGLNLMVLPFLVEIMQLSPPVAQTGYACIVIITSYFWYSRFTFRPKRS